ncbi:MAG: PaaI family thioesterase [Cytophagales bacterium]|nr:MAG: PaaI family thioesterase [Cytophagales bacterium]
MSNNNENGQQLPEGFEPLFRTSPFLDNLGKFYYQKQDSIFSVGTFVSENHLNNRGFAHAGLFTTLADIALGYGAAFSKEPPVNLVTVSLSTDFVGNAQLGDFVEARVDVQKIGKQVAFANAFIFKNQQERIVRVSAVFSVL